MSARSDKLLYALQCIASGLGAQTGFVSLLVPAGGGRVAAITVALPSTIPELCAFRDEIEKHIAAHNTQTRDQGQRLIVPAGVL